MSGARPSARASGRATALLASLLLAACCGAAAQYDYQWHTGRASFYGNDAWSIHKGNCGFGYISQDMPAGWDVVALSDKFPGFSGSCGRCYEIKCNPAHLHDYYGASFDRTGVCFNTSQSLLVRVVDSCPCNYPSNAYSNKRWCCGDMDHMDVSVWAFEKLADKKWGMIGIQYRAVPCNFQPDQPAPPVAHPPAGEYWSKTPPSFLQTGNMSIPKIWNPQQGSTVVQGWEFGDPTGSSSTPKASASASSSGGGSASAMASSSSGGGSSSSSSSASASASASSFASASGSGSASASATASAGGGGSAGWTAGAAQLGQTLSSAFGVGGGVHAASGPPQPSPSASGDGGDGSSSSSSSGDQLAVYLNGLQNGWSDASFSVSKVNWQAGNWGADGGQVVCADLNGYGALAVSHAPGAFGKATGLEFRVKTDSGRPQVTVNVGAGSKYCNAVPLSGMSEQERLGAWSRFSMHLGDLGGSYSSFQGCGGQSQSHLTTIEIKSTISYKQTICLDVLRLLSSSSSS